MSYRPITDVWILVRPKVKFYGASPAGFLKRARDLLGVRPHDPVLHVCAGAIRQYPGPHDGVFYEGLGPNDFTLDASPEHEPDFLRDATFDLPPLHVRRGTPIEDQTTPTMDVERDSIFMRSSDWGATTNLHAIDNGLWPAVLIDRPYTEADHKRYAASATVKLPPLNALLKQALRRVPLGGRVGVLDYKWPRPPLTGPVIGREVATIPVLTGRDNQARVYTVFERRPAKE